jgi:DNA-binding LacI/PurR family transcriptional regulator
MLKKTYTIRDIAKEAETSIATVSRFLNKSGYVDTDTAKKIELIINKLGYSPSRAAQSLKTKKSRQIMLVVPDICNPFYSTMAKTVQAIAKEKDYFVILYNTNEDPVEEIRAVKASEQINADGIILCSVYVKDEVIKTLENSNIHKVVANSYENCPFDSVHGVKGEGTYITTKHLIENGHRTIAFAGGPTESATAARRKYGFVNALKEAAIECKEDHIFEMGFSVDSGYKAGKYFSTLKPLPSAICCANDLIAFGILSSFSELGIRVPDDISITGMDNIDFTNLSRPRLTTATNDSSEFGKSVANLLFDRIESKYSGSPREVIIPRILVPRDSVKNIKNTN